MVTVPINRMGRALEGEYAGQFVRVEQQPTGSYLVLWSTYADMNGSGSDHWVENDEELGRYFARLNIDWTVPEPEYAPPN